MIAGLITILVTDCMLYLIIQLVHANISAKRGDFPLRHALILLLFCCIAHAGATYTMGRACETTVQGWLTLLVSGGLGAIPIAAYVTTVSRHPAITSAAVKPQMLAQARSHREAEEFDEALRCYCLFFDDNPSRADVLFEAADMLVADFRLDTAEKLLRRVAEQFAHDPEVRRKAVHRLAGFGKDPAQASPDHGAHPSNGAPTDEDRMRELIALREQGAVTEAEFQAQKRLLGRE